MASKPTVSHTPPTDPPAAPDPMVRATFTETIATDRECFVRGKTYELPRSRLAEYLDKNLATVQK